ncbi:MAG TPA: S53 family peptidase [Candidatus Dormibacteraeota bacterium]
MDSFGASLCTLWARVAAISLAAPMMLGASAPAAIVSHPMVPAVGSHVHYEYIGDTEELGLVKFGCQLAVPATCFGPDQIRAAYGIQPILDAHITGAGRTIVIIDAYQSPTIASDLAAFDDKWGLPAPPSFTIIAPDGLTPFDVHNATQVGWSSEISLDVEWAHAIAPGAAIVLVLAQSHLDADILSVTRWAVEHNIGDVISQSFGEAEMCADPELIRQEHALFDLANDKGITLVAASGDHGAAQPTCDESSFILSASTPASDPQVTAVGGTLLLADGRTGAYQSESAWHDSTGGTGGGFSTIYRRPGYQAPLQDNNKQRGVPDVAFDGARGSGVIGAWSVLCGISLNCAPTGGVGYMRFWGTSAGAPQWAGIVALADQMGGHRLGSINKTLYHIGKSDAYGSAFHDVTVGQNNFLGITGFPAGTGWDATTGLGTPRVAALIPLLI